MKRVKISFSISEKKALIRLRGYAGSAPLVFACYKVMFSPSEGRNEAKGGQIHLFASFVFFFYSFSRLCKLGIFFYSFSRRSFTFSKILLRTLSECQTIWIEIRTDDLSGLILIHFVCALVTKERLRPKQSGDLMKKSNSMRFLEIIFKAAKMVYVLEHSRSALEDCFDLIFSWNKCSSN